MENQEQVESFIVDLNAISIVPKLDGHSLVIEFRHNRPLQKEFVKLLNQYVGFWKSVAVETNHSTFPNISRYKIPFRLITGKDVTYDELHRVIWNITKII